MRQSAHRPTDDPSYIPIWTPSPSRPLHNINMPSLKHDRPEVQHAPQKQASFKLCMVSFLLVVGWSSLSLRSRSIDGSAGWLDLCMYVGACVGEAGKEE